MPALNLWLCVAATAAVCLASPGAYYNNINTALSGVQFRQQLTDLISSAKSISYAQLWDAFQSTDEGVVSPNVCPDNLIDDLYSAKVCGLGVRGLCAWDAHVLSRCPAWAAAPCPPPLAPSNAVFLPAG